MSLPSTQKTVVIEKCGGPEVLENRSDSPIPTPGPGQVLVKNAVSGINFIDTYFRAGLYPSPKPEILGREAAGTVVAVGPDPDQIGLRVGDRVAWLGTSGYAEYTAVFGTKAVKIPSGLSSEDVVASFMSGLTALAFTHETYKVEPGNWVLLHAAAGGTGLLMIQILKSLGVKIIGTAGGPEKVALVKRFGADHVIDYRSEAGGDWVNAVKKITDGRGVDAVYDSVGNDTWKGDLEVVKRKGTIIWFGNASGPVPPVPLNLLTPKCIKIARPTLAGYIATREEFEHYSNQLFGLLLSGKIKVHIHKIYDLSEVQQAHKDLENRKTTGKALLKVGVKCKR